MYVCICEIVSEVRRVPIHPLPVSSCPFETPASHPFLLLHLQVNTGFPFEWPILHYFWGEVESRYFFSFIGVIYIIILASFVEKTVKLHWRLCYKLIERVCRLISELSVMFPWSFFYVVPTPHCLNYCNLIRYVLKLSRVTPSPLFLQNFLPLLG